MKKIIISLFALLLLVSSCKKDKLQTLVLHTPQQVENTIVLNWEQANISDFKYYLIWRSSDGFSYTVINDITPTSDAYHRGITTFVDNTYPPGKNNFCYKINAVGEVNKLESQFTCYQIEHLIPLLKGTLQDAHYIDETNKVSVIVNDYGYKLKAFDLETEQYSLKETQISLHSSSSWCLWGKYNGKTELYNYDSDWTIYVYEASTLQQIASIQLAHFGPDPFAINNTGMIYRHSSSDLHLISRITHECTLYQPTNIFFANRLYYNSKDNLLYAINVYKIFYDDFKIQTFILDDNGNVTGEEMYSIDLDLDNYPLYIEKSSLFAVSTSSGIKILDMNTKTYHNTNLTRIPNLILLDNSYLYTYDQSSRSINQLSAENYSLIKSIPLRLVPVKFFVNNGYLFYFGQHDKDYHIFEKIKL